MMSLPEYKYVAPAEVESFVESCMKSVGTDPQHSKALAQVLREADVRGHVTHGLNRLGKEQLLAKLFSNRPVTTY